jgi:hypothetical protein
MERRVTARDVVYSDMRQVHDDVANENNLPEHTLVKCIFAAGNVAGSFEISRKMVSFCCPDATLHANSRRRLSAGFLGAAAEEKGADRGTSARVVHVCGTIRHRYGCYTNDGHCSGDFEPSTLAASAVAI